MLRFIPDRMMVKLQYRLYMRKKLNLKNPVKLSEKLQWLKLYNKNTDYDKIVDKFIVRELITKSYGEKYLVPLLGVYDNFDEIDFSCLPNRFVIKCTHGSQSNVIVYDKEKFDLEDIKKKINFWMKLNWYHFGREYPYKNIKPRIIIEEYVSDSADVDYLTDYKFYCYNGKVDAVLICLDRNIGKTKYYFFNENWELLRYNHDGVNAPAGFKVKKPEHMSAMFEMAKDLCKGFPFIRVDMYYSNGNIFIGELTLFPASGYDPNRLLEADILMGSKLNLNETCYPEILRK